MNDEKRQKEQKDIQLKHVAKMGKMLSVLKFLYYT